MVSGRQKVSTAMQVSCSPYLEEGGKRELKRVTIMERVASWFANSEEERKEEREKGRCFMKKALVILVVLAMAAPLYADTITFSCPANGIIQYDATGAIAPVAMALDVDADGTIAAVAVDSFFDIFMDAAHDMEETAPGSYGYGDGISTANQDAVGSLALPSAEFCISMGGLGGDVEPLDPAPMSGQITLTTGTATSATITANVLRGAVVGTDGVEMTVTGLPLTVPLQTLDCMQEAGIDTSDPVRYAAFLEAGSPECWCEAQQCHGNADGLDEGDLKTGYYAVGGNDLTTLLAGWGLIGGAINGVVDANGVLAACANFDNDMVADPLLVYPPAVLYPGGKEGDLKTGYYQVGGGDLAIMLAYWGQLNPFTPGDCVPGNR